MNLNNRNYLKLFPATVFTLILTAGFFMGTAVAEGLETSETDTLPAALQGLLLTDSDSGVDISDYITYVNSDDGAIITALPKVFEDPDTPFRAIIKLRNEDDKVAYIGIERKARVFVTFTAVQIGGASGDPD